MKMFHQLLKITERDAVDTFISVVLASYTVLLNMCEVSFQQSLNSEQVARLTSMTGLSTTTSSYYFDL